MFSKIRAGFYIGMFAVLAMFTGAASARSSFQEGEPEYPTYVVQAGDTLSSIALKFGVDVASIVNHNNISDPNQLYQGAKVVIPGIDWVQGELDKRSIPLGESYQSILRRYNIPGNTLGRLSDLSSPTQIYVGYAALLPVDRDRHRSSARIAVGAETSLLELAVANNSNPWALVSANDLPGIWSVASGDVIFVPGSNDPGPGALPSPITNFEVVKGNFAQGKTTVVRIKANGIKLQLSGSFINHQLAFFQDADNSMVALQGVHAMTEPGTYPFEVNGILEDGTSFKYSQMVGVKEWGYGSEKISIKDSSYLDPAITQPEMDYLISIVSKNGEQKLWEGIFQAPSPHSDTINSYFGTRRAFNGSEYDFYHSGVDFGGGLGVEITAPASGVVVLAEALEIRGNATIIDHGWGIYSGYWHQSEIKVNVGDFVTPGQIIGIVGNTGRSSGAHLHWEMWVGGVQVEPLDWLFQFYP